MNTTEMTQSLKRSVDQQADLARQTLKNAIPSVEMYFEALRFALKQVEDGVEGANVYDAIGSLEALARRASQSAETMTKELADARMYQFAFERITDISAAE